MHEDGRKEMRRESLFAARHSVPMGFFGPEGWASHQSLGGPYPAVTLRCAPQARLERSLTQRSTRARYARDRIDSAQVGYSRLAMARAVRGLLRTAGGLRQRQGRLFVLAGAHGTFREHAVRGDPLEALLVDLLGVGLEHQALSGAPAPRVHLGVEAVRELVLVIVRVELRPQVEVALRLAQRAEELAQVLRVRIAVDHGADHEGAVAHLAIAALLREIVRP